LVLILGCPTDETPLSLLP